MEHLAGEAPLCSMRFPFTSSNVRILFVYQEGHLYLLAAFYERAGKRKPVIQHILQSQGSV